MTVDAKFIDKRAGIKNRRVEPAAIAGIKNETWFDS